MVNFGYNHSNLLLLDSILIIEKGFWLKGRQPLYTNTDKSNGDIPTGKDVGDVATRGLKYYLIQHVKKQAEGELNKTDWYITRKSEKDTAIPSAITTHRDAVRSKQASMETAITNASDTPALETLYTRNDSGVRPLGDLPILE